MTDQELIARQAKELAELQDKVALALEAFKYIRNTIYCIGGPLNDNVLEFNEKQMVVFSDIDASIPFDLKEIVK